MRGWLRRRACQHHVRASPGRPRVAARSLIVDETEVADGEIVSAQQVCTACGRVWKLGLA